RPRARRFPWRSRPLARTGRCASLPRYYAVEGTRRARLRENHAGVRRRVSIMLIERVWSASSGRNFHYLVACPESGEALAIDPLEWRLCMDAAREKGWEITQILNTHEHLDHTGGNAGLVGATGARVLAHAAAASRIGGVDQGLGHGDLIR